MEIRARAQFAEAGLLQHRIVIAVEVIETMNGPAVGKKPARQMIADEAGSTGDQNGIAHFVVPPQILQPPTMPIVSRRALNQCKRLASKCPRSRKWSRSIRTLTASARFGALSTIKPPSSSWNAVRRSLGSAFSNVPPGSHPAWPAARSCARSPTIHERAILIFMRLAASMIIPGLGLRHG